MERKTCLMPQFKMHTQHTHSLRVLRRPDTPGEGSSPPVGWPALWVSWGDVGLDLPVQIVGVQQNSKQAPHSLAAEFRFLGGIF